MAIAGGACSAYRMQVQEGELRVVQATTTLRSQCPSVEDALRALASGEIVTVAGADVAEIRQRVDVELRSM